MFLCLSDYYKLSGIATIIKLIKQHIAQCNDVVMLAHAIGHSGLALGPLFLSLLTRTYLGSFGLFPLGSFGFQHEDHYLISVLRCDNSSDRPSKPKSQEGECQTPEN